MNASSKRDSSIDFWRGMALVMIFINHIPGNALEKITHRNFGFSDAAELFVFLAGLSAALAYYPKFTAGNRIRQGYRAVNRAFTLYLAHIGTLVAALALFSAAVLHTNDPRLFELIGVGHLSVDPVRTILGVATLGFQPAYFNILPLYIVLVALLPLIMTLARINLLAALAASAVLYLAAQFIGFSLPHYPIVGPWFLNPFAWQLLFVIGFVVGARPTRLPFHPLVFWAAASYLAIGLICRSFDLRPEPDMLPLPRFIWDLNKGLLSLPRLFHVLALAYVVAHLPVNDWLRRLKATNPIGLLGRHALPMFCLGSLLSALGQILQFVGNRGTMFDMVYIALGLAGMVGLARVLEWHRSGTGKESAQRAAVGTPRAPSSSPSSF